MATTLADYTSVGLMIPELRGNDVASVIQELSLALQQRNRMPDMLPFYQAALNREFLASSDTEVGMAIPHAPLAGLREPVFAVGRRNRPVYGGAKALRTVTLGFLIAEPDTGSTGYLLLISSLARLSQDKGLMEKLDSAHEAKQIYETLQQVKLHAGHTGNLADKGGG